MNMERINYKEINGYFIPMLSVPAKERAIGRWGRMRLKYLKEHRPIVFSHHLLSGKLGESLAEIDQQANTRELLLIKQMKKKENVTEELKAQNQMDWARRMNSICSYAEEIVKHEIIYT